jgi:hypothetical protein
MVGACSHAWKHQQQKNVLKKRKIIASVCVMAFDPLAQRFSVMVAELFGFFRGEILFFGCMQVLLHLFYDMLGLVKIGYLEVRRCFCNFMRMSALGAEFPFLEMVHVRKGTAGRAADDKVHGKDVMCFILLKIYRRFFIRAGCDLLSWGYGGISPH